MLEGDKATRVTASHTHLDNPSLVNEQVLWLEVPMQDAALMAVQDGIVDLVQVALYYRWVHELREANQARIYCEFIKF